MGFFLHQNSPARPAVQQRGRPRRPSDEFRLHPTRYPSDRDSITFDEEICKHGPLLRTTGRSTGQGTWTSPCPSVRILGRLTTQQVEHATVSLLGVREIRPASLSSAPGNTYNHRPSSDSLHRTAFTSLCVVTRTLDLLKLSSGTQG